jgi:hypothetical protein
MLFAALAFIVIRRVGILKFRMKINMLRETIRMRRLQWVPLDDIAQPDGERAAELMLMNPVHAHEDEERYRYDTFVSYAEEDVDWVQNVLMPVVEGGMGLRLCLHYRNFHPGKQILDSIECCLEDSRRMMFVFSPHFAHSRWCQFELSLGHDHMMGRNQDLLVIYLSDVPPEELTAGMAAILRSCTYLRWTAERGQDASHFWSTLRIALTTPWQQEIRPVQAGT